MGKTKLNIPIVAALILLMMTMISFHLTSGLFARYTVSTSAGDSARVAMFDVQTEVQPVQGKEGQFTISVTNNSEVAVEYNICVSFDAAMSVTIGDVKKEATSGASSFTFTNADWVLAPNAENPAVHTMQFEIINWTGLTSRDNNSGETEQVPLAFDVAVTAQQID